MARENLSSVTLGKLGHPLGFTLSLGCALLNSRSLGGTAKLCSILRSGALVSVRDWSERQRRTAAAKIRDSLKDA